MLVSDHQRTPRVEVINQPQPPRHQTEMIPVGFEKMPEETNTPRRRDSKLFALKKRGPATQSSTHGRLSQVVFMRAEPFLQPVDNGAERHHSPISPLLISLLIFLRLRQEV